MTRDNVVADAAGIVQGFEVAIVPTAVSSTHCFSSSLGYSLVHANHNYLVKRWNLFRQSSQGIKDWGRLIEDEISFSSALISDYLGRP